jgi:hypothetical protein
MRAGAPTNRQATKDGVTLTVRFSRFLALPFGSSLANAGARYTTWFEALSDFVRRATVSPLGGLGVDPQHDLFRVTEPCLSSLEVDTLVHQRGRCSVPQIVVTQPGKPGSTYSGQPYAASPVAVVQRRPFDRHEDEGVRMVPR